MSQSINTGAVFIVSELSIYSVRAHKYRGCIYTPFEPKNASLSTSPHCWRSFGGWCSFGGCICSCDISSIVDRCGNMCPEAINVRGGIIGHVLLEKGAFDRQCHRIFHELVVHLSIGASCMVGCKQLFLQHLHNVANSGVCESDLNLLELGRSECNESLLHEVIWAVVCSITNLLNVLAHLKVHCS